MAECSFIFIQTHNSGNTLFCVSNSQAQKAYFQVKPAKYKVCLLFITDSMSALNKQRGQHPTDHLKIMNNFLV